MSRETLLVMSGWKTEIVQLRLSHISVFCEEPLTHLGNISHRTHGRPCHTLPKCTVLNICHHEISSRDLILMKQHDYMWPQHPSLPPGSGYNSWWVLVILIILVILTTIGKHFHKTPKNSIIYTQFTGINSVIVPKSLRWSDGPFA